MGLADKLRSAKVREWTLRPEVLLSANTVKPMHGVTPRTILGREWWDATRHAAYESTGFHCVACGVSKYQAREHQWLEGHELYRTDYRAGRMTYVETVPLCHYCHCFIHDGRLTSLCKKGEIPFEKVVAVMDHGRAVLRVAKLKKGPAHTGKTAEWGSWRLVLQGRMYPPLYPTFEDWKRAFDPTTEE